MVAWQLGHAAYDDAGTDPAVPRVLTELLTNDPAHAGSPTYTHGPLERSNQDWYGCRLSLIRNGSLDHPGRPGPIASC